MINFIKNKKRIFIPLIILSASIFFLKDIFKLVLYKFDMLEYVIDGREYPIKGIDVSHYQDKIKWDEVVSSGVSFAYIKATEANSFFDEFYLKNLVESKKNNILVGSYHFYSLCLDGGTQADWFIKNVPKDSQTLPPAIDLELYKNCNDFDPEHESEEIIEFISIIENYYGAKVLIYTTEDFYKKFYPHLKHTFLSNPIWIRSVYEYPGFLSNKIGIKTDNVVIWQYSDTGKIKGINGNVDLNTFLCKKNSQEIDKIYCQEQFNNFILK